VLCSGCGSPPCSLEWGLATQRLVRYPVSTTPSPLHMPLFSSSEWLRTGPRSTTGSSDTTCNWQSVGLTVAAVSASRSANVLRIPDAAERSDQSSTRLLTALAKLIRYAAEKSEQSNPSVR
jgi:hypothetical protein